MQEKKITLKPGWHRRGRTRGLLPEGTYGTRCETVQYNATGQIEAGFVITEDGPYQGRRITHRFDPEQDEDLFYEFVSCLDVQENARSISLKKFTGASVQVHVAHKKRVDGNYEASITGYQAAPGQRMLVEEGVYNARLESLEERMHDGLPDPQRLQASLRICNHATEGNRLVYECFNLKTYPEKFYELLDAAGMDPDQSQFTYEDLVGKIVQIRVVHRQDDKGQFWANIAYYRAIKN